MSQSFRVVRINPLNITKVRVSKQGASGSGIDPLTQSQVEDPNDTTFGSVSGQRIWQAIKEWSATAASKFQGILSRYTEAGELLTVVTGAVSSVWSSSANILNVPSLTQNTVITFTGSLTALKPVTLATVPDTGGPWTLSYIANGKTKVLTRNGTGTADLETFEMWSDGNDVFTIEAGGTVWSKGV